MLITDILIIKRVCNLDLTRNPPSKMTEPAAPVQLSPGFVKQVRNSWPDPVQRHQDTTIHQSAIDCPWSCSSIHHKSGQTELPTWHQVQSCKSESTPATSYLLSSAVAQTYQRGPVTSAVHLQFHFL